MSTVLSMAYNYGAEWARQHVATFDQQMAVRGAAHAGFLAYFAYRILTSDGRITAELSAFTAGVFLTALRREGRIEPLDILSHDPDFVAKHPLYSAWFPTAMAIDHLFPTLSGGNPHRTLNLVIGLKAGVAVGRLFRGDLLTPRAID